MNGGEEEWGKVLFCRERHTTICARLFYEVFGVFQRFFCDKSHLKNPLFRRIFVCKLS